MQISVTEQNAKYFVVFFRQKSNGKCDRAIFSINIAIFPTITLIIISQNRKRRQAFLYLFFVFPAFSVFILRSRARSYG